VGKKLTESFFQWVKVSRACAWEKKEINLVGVWFYNNISAFQLKQALLELLLLCVCLKQCCCCCCCCCGRCLLLLLQCVFATVVSVSWFTYLSAFVGRLVELISSSGDGR